MVYKFIMQSLLKKFDILKLNNIIFKKISMPKAYNPNDTYFRQAKKRGLRARSAFKLEEILEKFPTLMRKKANVVDLGACPGSFLQILAEKNPGGKICGVDLQDIEKFPRNFPAELKLIKGDIYEEDTADQILKFFDGKKADFITSDMAPNTSGITSVDQFRSIELNERVLEICDKQLKYNGNLVTKIFKGEDFEEFWMGEFRDCFEKTKTFKPKACRDRSFEMFLIGIGWKGEREQKKSENEILEEMTEEDYLREMGRL